MPNDTFYPALDGSSPGDNKEVVQDLGDTPLLEPLFPQSEYGVSPSQIEGFDPAAPPAESAPPAEPPRRKSVQERIDRLTKRNHEAKNSNDVLSQQLAALAQQNQMLFSQLMQSRAPQGAPASAPTDPYGSADPGLQSSGTVDIRRQIADAVRGEVAPISQSLRDLHTGNAIRQAHEQSFVEAAGDYPELRDARSEFRKVFNDLYDAAPVQIKQLPDAPMHFALQARGILADAKTSETTKTAQKRAANIHVPTPTATDEPTAGLIPKSVESAAAAAKQRLRDGISTHEDYVLLRRLSQFRQHRQE